jgi:predicted nuclease of restriction endonuclease-like (RecB) superfamily
MKTQHTPQTVLFDENVFVAALKQIVASARTRTYAAINFAQVEANWLIGRQLVEQEQHGKARAEYGKHVIAIASRELSKEFGKGFSERNLWKFKQFYLLFPEYKILPTASAVSDTSRPRYKILPTLSAVSGSSPEKPPPPTILGPLPWSHYERLLRVDKPEAREWYMREASEQSWTFRTLDRNINTQYYERLLSSQIRKPVIAEMKAKTKAFQQDKLAFIKNPAVLEFLGLPGNVAHTEEKIEQALLDNMQKFLLELGKGFAFVDRQKLIRTEAGDYFIDLVFYNYILKCFVLIDLKIGKVTHQDVGQMDMYVRMFDERERREGREGREGDNPTIGIVLCSETDHDIARYSVLKGSEQLFATKYKLYLPTEEELRAEIVRQKELLAIQFPDPRP